ncbi:flagellar biosynthesis protein FlhF [Treponema parvum]|uniref:Flagellar biosynthesis protein FlhF n=1 Tax=Treponema parvum TaxID=138851 RepID=A0A975ID39_9SPIR|nr:flagellar biosynthesis protein FlhF [Treponema parvum]QTQ11744.1 flagellar biosynthesis protein FlhF [Treponema parvum]
MYAEDKDAPVFTERGANYEECRIKLGKQYGDDYQIIGKRQVLEGGFLGFFQKEAIEVTYILRPHGMVRRSRQNGVQGQPSSTFSSSAFRPDAPYSISAGFPASESANDFQRARDDVLRAAGANVDSVKQMASLKQSVDELKTMLNEKVEMVISGAPSKHPTIQKIEELLEKNEFTFSYISAISKRLGSDFSLDQLDDFDFVEKIVVDWIGESISVHETKAFRPPHVIILVGPTGVGKTTTIAKLAANLILDAKENNRARPEMRFISIDKTRVGALEQLVNYGEIMNVPVDKAETPADVKTIYNEYRDRTDAILIDTSGYSPNDSKNIGQMRSVLDLEDLHADVYLAVSATTKARDLNTIIQNYEPFAFQSVIITKCDETHQYGNVISVLHEKRKSVSYITDGQRVPRNIHRADVVNFLMELNDFKIDRVHIDDKFGVK